MPARPDFAKDYPKALDDLVAAFEAGNYALVRREAQKLSTDEDQSIREAARDLLSRTGPDRLQLGLLGITLTLLVGLSVYWITHQEPPKTPVKGSIATTAVETPR